MQVGYVCQFDKFDAQVLYDRFHMLVSSLVVVFISIVHHYWSAALFVVGGSREGESENSDRLRKEGNPKGFGDIVWSEVKKKVFDRSSVSNL